MQMLTLDALLQSWRVNNEMNLKLFDAIPEEHLANRASPRGRTVGEQWLHVHDVRMRWMAVKASKLAEDIRALAKSDAHSKAVLRQGLVDSAHAFETVFVKYADGLKAKGKNQSVLRFYSYMIAHEAYHRGQIILHLKLTGCRLAPELKFGLWGWG